MARPVSARARRLKQAAGDAGLTAEQIAERIHMSSAAIRHWWTDRCNPSFDMMEEYGRITGVSAWWLWTGEKEAASIRGQIEASLEQFYQAVGATAAGEGDGSPSAGERIAAAAGADWLDLSPKDRQAVLVYVRQVAEYRRGSGSLED